jgi:hypothetical protein
MTHFLARLVERVRGTTQRVEPIVAARFQPAAVTEVTSEIEASPPPAARNPRPPLETSSPDSTIARQEESKSLPAEEKLDAPPREPVQETLLVPPELVTIEAPLVGRRTEQGENPARLARDGAGTSKSFPHPQTTRPQSPAPATMARRAARDVERSLFAPNETSVDRPIVRVTIGRIDVRAETAPPPPRKQTLRSEPKLTLEAYLKSRKEDAR